MGNQIAKIKNFRLSNPCVSTSIELSRLVFFDIETTGLRPDRGGEIIEVAILNRSNPLFVWQTNPDNKTNLVSKQLPEIIEQLHSAVVVGHNLAFDLWFISYESNRIGLEGFKILFIDTLSLAKKVLPNRDSYQLGNLIQVFHIKADEDLHNAITDATVTRALFWKLIEKGGISTVGEAGLKKMNW